MSKYLYNALNSNNKDVIVGEVEAETPREARQKVRELGYMPLRIYDPSLVTTEEVKTGENRGSITFLSLSDKISFVTELEVMLASGISVVEALSTVEDNSPKPKIKRLASELKKSILAGRSFTESLNLLYHDVFGDIFIDLCETGEYSGELDLMLRRVSLMLKKQEEIKSDIVHASIYPCILLVIMFGLLVLFAKFVFPAITAMLVGNGAQVPAFAGGVIATMNFINSYWVWCILAAVALGYCLHNLMRNPETRSFFDKLVLKIPILNEFISYINLSNYMCVMNIAYESGVPFDKTLALATKTIGNTEIKQKALKANALVAKGNLLSDSLSMSKLLPGALITMVAAGEKSGSLSKMLEECVIVIDKKIDIVLKALTKAFEPALIVILGVVVGVIAFAFMQLYVSMIQSIL